MMEHIKNYVDVIVRGFSRGLLHPFNQLNGMMNASDKSIKSWNKQGLVAQSMLARVAQRTREAGLGLRKFRMELLSVMFFGMMLQQKMLGLLQPASDALGFGELWGTMLTVLFLPIMSELLPLFIQLIDYFMSLPEPVQKAIGAFILLIAALGTIMLYGAAIGLGIAGLEMFFGKIITGSNSANGALAKILMKFQWLQVLAMTGISIGLILYGFNLLKSKTTFLQGLGLIFANFPWFISSAGYASAANWVGAIGLGLIILDLLLNPKKKSLFSMDGVVTLLGGAIAGYYTAAALGLSGVTGIGIGVTLVILAWKLGPSFKKNILDPVAASGTASGKGFKKAIDAISAMDVIPNVYGDVIWRPGQSPIAVSPNDTIYASKQGSGGSSIINNFYGFTNDDLKRSLDARDRKIADDVLRKVGG